MDIVGMDWQACLAIALAVVGAIYILVECGEL